MKTQNSRKFHKKLRWVIILASICFMFAMSVFDNGAIKNNLRAGASPPAIKTMELIVDGGRKPTRPTARTIFIDDNKDIETANFEKASNNECVKKCSTSNIQLIEEEKKPRLAIVIDDFGMDRRGVDEMLSIDVPLTIAVMPGLDFSVEDAEKAHQMGHEVILHMPMENMSYMPPEYYGPKVVRNSMTTEEAVSLVKESIDSIPYAVGMNIHMGTGVSRNERLISAIMEEMKKKNKYFLDSKTIEDSVCPKCAEKTGVKFYQRDVFLEPSGRPSESVAYNYIITAGQLALENGEVIAIGHVGPVGEEKTAKAIKNALLALKNMGVEVVPLSKL